MTHFIAKMNERKTLTCGRIRHSDGHGEEEEENQLTHRAEQCHANFSSFLLSLFRLKINFRRRKGQFKIVSSIQLAAAQQISGNWNTVSLPLAKWTFMAVNVNFKVECLYANKNFGLQKFKRPSSLCGRSLVEDRGESTDTFAAVDVLLFHQPPHYHFHPIPPTTLPIL